MSAAPYEVVRVYDGRVMTVASKHRSYEAAKRARASVKSGAKWAVAIRLGDVIIG